MITKILGMAFVFCSAVIIFRWQASNNLISDILVNILILLWGLQLIYSYLLNKKMFILGMHDKKNEDAPVLRKIGFVMGFVIAIASMLF